MNDWTPIIYRDFYDIPRIFLAETDRALFLFNCTFDSEKDEYEETYKVYAMPPLRANELSGSWEDLPAKATRLLGTIRTAEVEFDSTRREKVNLNVLRRLLLNEE